MPRPVVRRYSKLRRCKLPLFGKDFPDDLFLATTLKIAYSKFVKNLQLR